MIGHRKRIISFFLELMGEIRGRSLAREGGLGPIIITIVPLPLLARNQVFAQHFHLVLLLKTLDVDGKVRRWTVVVEAEAIASGAPGADAADGGHMARTTAGEHERQFCGRGGTGGTGTGGAGPRSGWDVR